MVSCCSPSFPLSSPAGGQSEYPAGPAGPLGRPPPPAQPQHGAGAREHRGHSQHRQQPHRHVAPASHLTSSLRILFSTIFLRPKFT